MSASYERVPAEGGAALHGAEVEEGDQGEDSGGEGRKVTSSPQNMLFFLLSPRFMQPNIF